MIIYCGGYYINTDYIWLVTEERDDPNIPQAKITYGDFKEPLYITFRKELAEEFIDKYKKYLTKSRLLL